MGSESRGERERKGRGSWGRKEDPGWNFNDGVDRIGERNPHDTRSPFLFAKAY